MLNAPKLLSLRVGELTDRPQQLRPRAVRDDELAGGRAARLVDEDAELETLAGAKERSGRTALGLMRRVMVWSQCLHLAAVELLYDCIPQLIHVS